MLGYLSADSLSVPRSEKLWEQIISKDTYIRAYFRSKWRLLRLLSFHNFSQHAQFWKLGNIVCLQSSVVISINISISLFNFCIFSLFLWQQLQPNANSLEARPQLTDWWAPMCLNVMKTVVSSLNSAGDQQDIAGVWTSTARKCPALESEENRTAVRKVTS